MIFRIYYERCGPHVHCRLFAGEGDALVLCGKLIMSHQQFDSLMGAENAEIGQYSFVPEMRNASVDDPATEDIVATWLSLPIGLRTRDRLREALEKQP